MEKITFLKSRDQKLLVALIDVLASDLHYEVDEHLVSLPADADEVVITRHDRSLLNVYSLCESLEFILSQLKSTLV